MVDTSPKLDEIAARIGVHLHRIELARSDRDSGSPTYWGSQAWRAGSYLGVKYVSFQGNLFLTKTQALVYLAWLDAGNEGKHFQAMRDAAQ
jgi:hypothetical protein